MPGRHTLGFSTLAVLIALAFPANAQSVISAHSGVIHFFEGSVYLGDRPLASQLGKFSTVPPGAELRTEEGRAEVLLTPGVFLRIGERSAIRMVNNDLSDTRVELLAGSAIVDASEPSSDTSVTILYQGWNVRVIEQGVYRIDSEPPRVWVTQGKAEVSAGASEEPVSVEQGMYMPFAAVLVPERSISPPRDALSNWAEGREQSISADNTIAANIQDPASMDNSILDADSFTRFPMLGLAPLGSGLSSPYTPWGLYQPGFNSIYLPGYTYRPLILGLVPGRYRTPLSSSPRIGVSPSTFPRPPVSRPAPVRTVPHVGVRAGGHR
ncbi:MAG TPA: FecR domain-containing protein [Bryobacteraceae bacterium]|nr:FecR domain-containing protein [Bryobacteraceae bacterium]